MRMYEYIKQSGATPVLQEQHARCGEFSTLEDLFEQTVSDYQKRINALTSLTEDAQAANDKSAINFLKRYRGLRANGTKTYAKEITNCYN